MQVKPARTTTILNFKTLEKTARTFALAGLFPAALFFLLDFLFPFEPTVTYSQVIYSKQGGILEAFLTPEGKWRIKAEAGEITPDLQKAIIAKEDKYFYRHFGINPFALARAAFNNMLRMKKSSGASTISMQVVRLLRPKQRTYSNKILEMFHASQLELHHNKKEILLMYLNLAPYGGNVEGVKSASLLFFGKMPGQLSLAQITALTIVPNRPTSWALGRNNALIERERNRWLQTFAETGVFDKQTVADAQKEPLEAIRNPFKKIAPHFTASARKASGGPLQSSIDESIQTQINQIAFEYMQKLKQYGILNAAVLVVENEGRKVRAYMGSNDFFDAENNGQVDGIQSLRSPGSTLKPLIYAIGFDKGLFTPKQTVLDVPVDYGGYRPENFDRHFNGRLSIEKSLAFSLNVPAVKALDQIGVPVMLGYLKKASFGYVSRNENRFGLSLALGGCGASLWEMCGLYAAFADGGRFLPLSVSENEKTAAFRQLFSPSAAFMVTDILSQIERPDFPNNYQSSTSVPKIAWKTGTSYSRKDAWSIGYNQKYTVGVWIGNFSGKGAAELTGASIATPLLFRIFNVIEHKSESGWFDIPKELDFREVCAVSGKIPESFCENRLTDSFIPKVSSVEKCRHLRYVFVDANETESYCSACLPGGNFKKILHEQLEPELMAYYRHSGIPFKSAPPHHAACSKVYPEGKPVIVSPSDGREYYSTDGQEVSLMLACQLSGDAEKVFWYLDDAFLGSAQPAEKIFAKAGKGRHKLSCSDDKGRNSDIVVWVK